MKKVVKIVAPRSDVHIGLRYSRHIGVEMGEEVQVVATKPDRLVIYPLRVELCEKCEEPLSECICKK